MSDGSSASTIKYYTHARRFPQLLGRLPDGTKIPGGPYTIHQLSAGIGVLLVGVQTVQVWGAFGKLGNIVVLLGIVYTTIVVVGRISTHGRNPLVVLSGLLRVVSAPRTGRFQGRPIRIRRPHRVTVRVNVFRGELPEADAAPLREASPAPWSAAESHEADGSRPEKRTRLVSGASGLDKPGHHQPLIPLTGLQTLLSRADAGAPSRRSADGDA